MVNLEKPTVERLNQERYIMTAYSETAKVYTQLSIGALVLSVTFFKDVLAATGALPVDVFLIISWSGWLLTAVAGAFYQYLAVRYLELLGEEAGIFPKGEHFQVFHRLTRQPALVYGCMLLTFYLGSAAFVVVGIAQLV